MYCLENSVVVGGGVSKGGEILALGVSKGEIGGGVENPSWVGKLHVCVDDERICHV